MKPLKTETEAELRLLALQSFPALTVQTSDEYTIEAFFASSHTATRCFRMNQGRVDFNKTSCNNLMKLKSIVGNTIELWLTLPTQNGKIIGAGSINIDEEGEKVVEFKLENELFAKLTLNLSKFQKIIEKEVYIEPDEDLLKKTVDPGEEARRKEEEENRRLRQQYQMEEQARQQKKKPAVTLTTHSKKDQPFV